MATVLVTDAWLGKSLSAIRSLGAAGFTVHAVSHTYNSFGFYSGYTKKYFKLPHPQKEPEAYAKALLSLLSTHKYDCIIPMEDYVIKILYTILPQIEQLTTVALPPKDSYYIAYDKLKTLQLAEQLGVPCPQTFYPNTLADLEAVKDKLTYPLIIKPVSSSGSRGLKKVYNQTELFTHFAETLKNYGTCVVQQALAPQGQGKGVGLIAKNGDVLNAYTYTRLREFPVSGGPGTLREATDDAQTLGYAKQLIKALDWTGVAMVEFKTDVADGIPKLMEINPRFWGSLELARYAGLNFPEMLYQLSVGQIPPPQTYTIGQRARWLFPGDLAHFVFNPKRFSLKPSFFNFWDKNTRNDHLQCKDLKGTLAFVVCTFLSFLSPEIWKIGLFRR